MLITTKNIKGEFVMVYIKNLFIVIFSLVLIFIFSACSKDKNTSTVTEKFSSTTIISVPVKAGNKWGYIDKTGKYVINAQFEDANRFSDGLAPVKLGGKYGYIDKTGKYVISAQFDFAGLFSDGIAPVELGGKWGFIDKTGKYLISPQFDDIRVL
jgi:hypothetical protein